MHAIVYKFNVSASNEESFISAWKSVTENIYKERGSLGSRLHKDSDGNFIAYAQWPSLEQANKEISTSDKYKKDLDLMISCLESSEVLYRLNVLEDLLEKESLS